MRRFLSRAAPAPVLILAAATLVGCGGGGDGSTPPAPPPPPPPPAASVERDVSPATVNPALTANLSAHFVVTPNPAVTAQNRLFVMLPGTGGVPRFYREIVRTGAERGWHSVGLTYPNDVAVGDLCAGSPDPDCAGKARREIITGEALSPVVAVTPENSILGRLTALITWLHATYPTEGWGGLLLGGQPNWIRVTAAGHSQGAGHAAYLGKMQSLDRIVMFSGPGDLGLPGSPAPWLSLPNVTPPGRQYGFTHTGDELVPLALVSLNWSLIGLPPFGAITSVDGVASPYGGSRQLITSAAPNPAPAGAVPEPRHSSPVVDAVTPLDGQGRPVYRPVWIYLAF